MFRKDDRLKRSVYEDKLAAPHVELVKMEYWIKETGQRLVLLFEGRDAAGKGAPLSVLPSHSIPVAAGSWL